REILIAVGVVRLAAPVVPRIRLARDPAPAAGRLAVVGRGAVLVETDPTLRAIWQLGQEGVVLGRRGDGDQVAGQNGVRGAGAPGPTCGRARRALPGTSARSPGCRPAAPARPPQSAAEPAAVSRALPGAIVRPSRTAPPPASHRLVTSVSFRSVVLPVARKRY